MNNNLILQIKQLFMPFCLLALMLCGGQAAAQERKTRVTLQGTQTELTEFIRQIESQTNYHFVPNPDIDLSRLVDIHVTDCPLEEALGKLFAGTNISYQIKPNGVILLSPSARPSYGPASVRGVVTDVTGMPVIGASVLV